ncbi:MAG: alpha/beta hydrolase [Planctomycetota bacterium]
MKFWANCRDRFLDRCILRPSRHHLPLVDQRRVVFDRSSSSNANDDLANVPLPSVQECFVHGDPSDRQWREATNHEISLEQIETIRKPEVLLLKFPGTAGRGERSTPFPGNQIRKRFRQHVETWTWNPPGHGGTSGRATLRSLVPAARAWCADVTRRRAGPQTMVVYVGNSLGCLPALAIAADSPSPQCQRAWLRNVPDLTEIVPNVASKYGLRRPMRAMVRSLPDELVATHTARRCHVPTVYLTSQLDQLATPPTQANVQQSHAGPHHVARLHGLAHDGLADETHEPVIEAALDWMMEPSNLE